MTMKKPFLLICFMLLYGAYSASYTQAQDSRTAKNTLYLELLGNGIFYSVNYEHFLSDQLAARAGISYSTLTSETSGQTQKEGNFFTFPLMLNYLVGKGSSHLELGGGLSIITFSETNPESNLLDFISGTTVLVTGTVGYRYQQPDGGFVFRIGFTPLTNFNVVAPWGGLSLGYAF